MRKKRLLGKVEPTNLQIRRKRIKRLFIAALLSAALVGLVDTPAQQNIKNVASEAKPQQVQAETTRKASTLSTEQDKAQTEPEPSPQPETVVATAQPVKVDPPAPQPQGCEAYRSLVSKYDWDARIALAVMEAESSCSPSATNFNVNGSTDRGLFQINSVHLSKVASPAQLFDPATNIQVAYAVYKGSGWQAWSAYNNGKHLKFL